LLGWLITALIAAAGLALVGVIVARPHFYERATLTLHGVVGSSTSAAAHLRRLEAPELAIQTTRGQIARPH